MKFFHLSDLHLGKRLKEFSLLEDQIYILDKIVNMAQEHKPDGIIIAGDIYDKSIPPVEAVELFDNFLLRLVDLDIKIFIISGNHDSPERVAFGSSFLDKSGIYISPAYRGDVKSVTVTDEYGDINIYMLPFIKPVHVRSYYPDNEILSYTDAMKTVIDSMEIDESRRNILVTHQFITGSECTDSETISVGGTDNVDAHVFAPFDYVALGHLHKGQKCGNEHIRYCGTPLKYSFSEANNKKSVTVVNIRGKGDISLEFLPLIPKRDMVNLKGKYEELTLKSFYQNTSYTEDYIHITLTDEEDVYDAMAKLRIIYKNITELDYDNERVRSQNRVDGAKSIEKTSPFEHFSNLYELQNGHSMSEEQSEYIKNIMNDIWGDNK